MNNKRCNPCSGSTYNSKCFDCGALKHEFVRMRAETGHDYIMCVRCHKPRVEGDVLDVTDCPGVPPEIGHALALLEQISQPVMPRYLNDSELKKRTALNYLLDAASKVVADYKNGSDAHMQELEKALKAYDEVAK